MFYVSDVTNNDIIGWQWWLFLDIHLKKYCTEFQLDQNNFSSLYQIILDAVLTNVFHIHSKILQRIYIDYFDYFFDIHLWNIAQNYFLL